jgi:hypothetical protein
VPPKNNKKPTRTKPKRKHVGVLARPSRMPKASASELVYGPVQLADSTAERPVVALHGSFDFPIGRSLEGDVRFVADAARDQAKTGDDAFLIGVARALDALELALRRRRTGATAADLFAVESLEKVAVDYLAGRGPQERWYGSVSGDGLRPRRNIDRPARLKDLFEFASMVALPKKRKPDDVALMMVTTLWAMNIVDTKGRNRADDIAALAKTIAKKLRPGRPIKFDEHALVVCTLKACGVPHVDANNWCKPLV